MKRIFLIALATAVVLISCKKDEDEEVIATSAFTANVGPIPWKAASYQASLYNGSIIIIGEAADGTKMNISLAGDTAGLYTLDQNSASTAIYSPLTGKGFSSAASADAGGEVLIESVNSGTKQISGSFQFTGSRPADDSIIEVTNGRFTNLKYNNSPLGIENNNLNVDVGGNPWQPLDVSGFVAFNTLFITALDADDTRSLSFELPYDIAPGKYEANYFTNYKAVYVSPSGGTFYAVKGTIEVVEHNLVNQEIEALFEIYVEEHEGSGALWLTSGSMKVNYE